MRIVKDDGWKRFANALDPKQFQRKLHRNIKNANYFNGKLLATAIRKAIKGGGFEKNAALTVMIKGSGKKPLTDQGELFKSIAIVVNNDLELFVGIVKDDEQYDLALAVHDGAEIRVTPAMRGLFFSLWQASIGAIPSSKLSGRAAELWERSPGGWKPLKKSTTRIVIPGRPFTKEALEDDGLKAKMEKNWRWAVEKTLKEAAKK